MSGIDTAPDKTSKKDDGNQISALQITAATCASTIAAVIATALGVYGTVIGVAVISVVSSVATVLFVRSMNRTKQTIDKVVKTRGITSKTPRTAVPQPRPAATGGTTKIIGTAAVPKPGDPRPAEPEPNQPKPDRKTDLKEFLKRNWRTLAITCVAVFALSVALLTGIALLSGEKATAYYGTDPGPAVTSNETGPGSGNDDEPGQSGDGESGSRPSEDGSDSPAPEESDTPEETSGGDEPTTQEPQDDGETTDEQRELKGTPPPDES